MRNNYKKLLIILFIFNFILIFPFGLETSNDILSSQNYIKTKKHLYSLPTTSEEIEKELNENVENQLKDIDFSKIDKIIENLDDTQKEIFNSNNFLSLVKKFINGENALSINNFFDIFLLNISSSIKNLLPYLSLILVIGLVFCLIQHFSVDKNISVKSVAYIACFCLVAVITLKIVMELLTKTTKTINIISSQMEIIFPILLTLTTVIGGVTTASSFQPILSTLTVFITKLFTTFLLPLVVFTFVFNIVGNITENIKLNKFSKFFSSIFNWTIGITFTIFIAFLALNGLTVSNLDGISLKTAKYAIKNYVPILGSYLSDGVAIIISSSIIIKNSIGVAGLVLIISTIISPILNILITMLAFKLLSAFFEVLGEQKISNFMFNFSKSLTMLNICLIASGVMYIISTSLLLMCSNIF